MGQQFVGGSHRQLIRGDKRPVRAIVDREPAWFDPSHFSVVIRRCAVMHDEVKIRMRVHTAREVGGVAYKPIRVRVHLRGEGGVIDEHVGGVIKRR